MSLGEMELGEMGYNSKYYINYELEDIDNESNPIIYGKNNLKVYYCTCNGTVVPILQLTPRFKVNTNKIKFKIKDTFVISEHLSFVNLKDNIRKSSIPFEIKPKRIFNEISKEIGFICPEYNTVRSQTTRYINKKLPYNIITNFDEIPDESEYYKTKRNEKFMIIFQSPF
ncbi:hypothetical protein BCR32DRAFT_287055 [Anaeromyces robustus]|uniref:Uncharacterized protein n=1 Tax=Anaeromyces robustus TaxID=1754192 RepID=A0A1Y1VUS9_9FUNG|nr:hypothetical protein BCR32DRAFT_287055 [Anaeromyces robustus]|eukprot:ORX64514.1 hypothetical protein BCR32DRAFT_287055 [Anaeromyces robustus]